jgi:dihydrodipicolinate synthase/N-acetylneuraminate lyase
MSLTPRFLNSLHTLSQKDALSFSEIHIPSISFRPSILIPSTAHVESQLAAGAVALLCMGSMGQQPYINGSQYPLVARACAESVRGSVPLYVGVSDVSVRRVAERIDALQEMAIDGVVATVSYYYALSQKEIVYYYRKIADFSPYPLYLYDLPAISQVFLSSDTVLTLMNHPNIRGIKSANITMLRKVMRDPSFNQEFRIYFSGLDIMDVASSYGLSYMLDGIFVRM